MLQGHYVKILNGELEGRVLRFTGTYKDTVTVEYVEVNYSISKSDCQPVVKGEQMDWETYDRLMGENK